MKHSVSLLEVTSVTSQLSHFDSIQSLFQFVQVVWKPLVTTMVTAVMVCSVPEDVLASRASKEVPVNCVPLAIMAPTAQVA